MGTPRIAVVDDDVTFQDLMREILDEQGWDVLAAYRGDETFDYLRLEQPDLILLDIRLGAPESGWKLLDRLRLDEATRHIPVVICSAAIRDVEAHEAFLQVCDISVVLKPFELEYLLATLARRLPHESLIQPNL